MLLDNFGLGESQFGETCKRSTTILLPYVEYFTNHTKQSSINYFPLEVDHLTSKYTFLPLDGFELSEASLTWSYTRKVLVSETKILKNHEGN